MELDFLEKIVGSTRLSSLRTADAFPVVASLPLPLMGA